MKIPIPKININLIRVLWAALFLIIIFESLILYRSLLASADSELLSTPAPAGRKYDINLPAFRQVHEWVEDKKTYEIPFSEEQTNVGIDNPFADY